MDKPDEPLEEGNSHEPGIGEPGLEGEAASLRQLLDALVSQVDSGLAALQLVTLLPCERNRAEVSAGPVELGLKEVLKALSDLRVRFELGDLTTDDVWDGLWEIRDQMPLPTYVDDQLEGRAGPLPWALMTIGGGYGVDPGLPPNFPPDPTPSDLNRVRDFLRYIKQLLRDGTLKGPRAERIRQLISEIERLVAERSPRVWEVFVDLLSEVGLCIRESAAAAAKLAGAGFDVAAMQARLRALRKSLNGALNILFKGSKFTKWFFRLNIIAWLLFAWDIGTVVGEEIAKVKVNDKETVGTWWGNRFWELMKGPCSDLLNALSQAIAEWHRQQAVGDKQGIVNALAKVLLLESEYIRRCLALGSAEREREERYQKILEGEYRKLVDSPVPGATPQQIQPGACEVEITLTSVAYGGDDIGSDWALSVFANNAKADIPIGSLTSGSKRDFAPPIVVYRGSFTPCSGTGLVTLALEARQRHWLGDTVGTNTKLLRPQCPTDTDQSIAVWVTEESTFWQRTYSALITYTFHIKAKCNAGSTAPGVVP